MILNRGDGTNKADRQIPRAKWKTLNEEEVSISLDDGFLRLVGSRKNGPRVLCGSLIQRENREGNLIGILPRLKDVTVFQHRRSLF